jgi:urea carboxylase system permease
MVATQEARDDRDLAKFGYKQELVRTLGSFSTFAIGFAFISILTGMFELFAFAYGSGGPASWWAWLVAVAGQLLFALAFAELAVHYPLAGSVYNWAKNIARRGTAWMAGVTLTLALVVSTAAVALAWQFVLPSISNVFWIYGNGQGTYDAATNGVILGAIMIAGTTIVSLLGTRVIKIVNNIGVTVELIAVALMVIFFLFHAKRGPGVVMQTNGTGSAYHIGYLGALLVSLLLGLYIMWGFDTAGSVGEETINPRKTNPLAIIRALLASGIGGALLLIAAFMAVGNLKAPQLSVVGLTYVVKSVLGTFLGDTLLVCVAIAIFVCCLANQTGAVRMIFAMARDNGLPGSHKLSRISERDKTPIVPVIGVAVIAILVLLVNIRQPQVVVVVTSDTVILALIAYVLVVGPFALVRIRGKWTKPEKGYFSLGRAGLAVSIAAFIWGVAMIINIAWPRRSIYNPVAPFHWWLQWGGILFPAICLAIAFGVYWFVQRHKIGILAEHAAETPPAGAEIVGAE